MMTCEPSKPLATCVAAGLIALLGAGPALAEKGVITQANGKCFSISAPSGFVLIRGWINAPVGATVEGPFNEFGPVPIFDRTGRDLTGGTARAFDENGNEVDQSAYVEDFGLTEDGLSTKWSLICEA